MSQAFPIVALGDPTKLGRLTHDQRQHVADMLARIDEDMRSLIATIDTWLEQAEPEAEPSPDPVIHCHWCAQQAVGVVEHSVLGIKVGLQPACLTHTNPKER